MKVLPETTSLEKENPAAGLIRLPQGLVGFPKHTMLEFLYQPDQLPFLWMRLHGPEPIHFVVIEPRGIIPDYELELFDEDTEFLGLNAPEEAAIFNIVTIYGRLPVEATVNLVGPVIVNRRTGLAKQVVLANHSRYSTHHPLIEPGPTDAAANF
jgi:flagellar assembly factor FliW